MKYSGFGLGHFLYIFLSAAIVFCFYFFIRKADKRKQLLIARVVSLALVVMYAVRIAWIVNVIGANIKYHLPLHMCSIAIVLLPIAMFCKSKVVANFLYLINAPGAAIAVIVPQVWFQTYDLHLFDYLIVAYYAEHALIITLAVFLTVKGYSSLKRSDIIKSGIFAAALYICMVVFNNFFGTYYFYTTTRENPVAFLYFPFSAIKFRLFNIAMELNPLYYLAIFAVAAVVIAVMYLLFRLLLSKRIRTK